MFHKSLHSINILNNELFNLQLIEENETSNGVAVFRIINQESEPTIERFIQIFKSLEELSNIFKKVHNDDSETKIYLLDSGSDTNLGLDTGVKVAKSLYLIFKEIWEYSFNRKQYKNSKNNEALLESLTIRAEIKKKREEGVITENEEIEYSHIVKTRVETLLGMNVVTKDIFDKFPENDTLRLSLVSFNHKLLSKENSLED